MRTIYIDLEFKCHTTNPEGIFREVETNFFTDKCTTFIEGYRFIPDGETWTRSDGKVFTGEMISPWKNYDELDAAQREYEKEQFNEYKESLEILGIEI
jgi:hypothetical protein